MLQTNLITISISKTTKTTAVLKEFCVTEGGNFQCPSAISPKFNDCNLN